jgi:hypothetical protein
VRWQINVCIILHDRTPLKNPHAFFHVSQELKAGIQLPKGYRPAADILDVKATTIDGSEIGSVTDGHIRLKGFLIPANLQDSGIGFIAQKLMENAGFGIQNVKGYPESSISIRKDIKREPIPHKFYMVPISFDVKETNQSSTHGLVLRPTGLRRQFRRVELFKTKEEVIIARTTREEERKQLEGQDMLYEEYDIKKDRYTITIV